MEMAMRLKLPGLKIRIVADILSPFTRFHLTAAEFAANKAQEIETKYKTDKPPQSELDLHLSQISTAIICSAAALESNINEYIISNEKKISIPCPNLIPSLLKRYPVLKKGDVLDQLFNSSDVLFKYNTIFSIIKNCLIYHPKDAPVRDIKYIIKLRNALVHYTPEWHSKLDRHAKLSTRRNKKRFPSSPFYDNERFPYFLSAQCAMTSFASSKEFIDFFKRHCQ